MALTLDGVPVIYFNSNALPPYHMLSNFAQLDGGLVLRPTDLVPALLVLCPNLAEWLPPMGAVFSSSEALWQALGALDKLTFLDFTVFGRFGTLEPNAFRFFYADVDQAIRKCAYWSKKRNVGILAKLASNPRYWVRLRLQGHMRAGPAPGYTRAVEAEAWHCILALKFRQNPDVRLVLESTRGSVLVEHDRGAGQRAVHWGGLVVGGALVGDNAMGAYLTFVRDHCL
jgi:hypothetical protein